MKGTGIDRDITKCSRKALIEEKERSRDQSLTRSLLSFF